MTTYAIGDIQGCYDELTALLAYISFDPEQDTLWLLGDLVNRGPKSLEVLRLVKNLSDSCIIVLGNHDLHLLAMLAGVISIKPQDTLAAILQAPDRDVLGDWLRHQKFLHYDPTHSCLLAHAGIAPQWNLQTSINCATELENALRADNYRDLFQHLYGNYPDYWDERLEGYERLRVICNYLTRMRFCDSTGKLNMLDTGKVGSQSAGLLPWYDLPRKLPETISIIFGHWAALEGVTEDPSAICLDTGCVWGRQLTALRLEDRKIFQVQSKYSYERL